MFDYLYKLSDLSIFLILAAVSVSVSVLVIGYSSVASGPVSGDPAGRVGHSCGSSAPSAAGFQEQNHEWPQSQR